ncbi:hypothetical protein ACO0QE_000683 [Hanseniaspora vineae]
MSYIEALINEILQDDSTISSLAKEEQKNPIDQDKGLQGADKTHTLYELLDTTVNARKTFFKVNSNLRGKSLSSHDREAAKRVFERSIGNVIQKWADQEAGMGLDNNIYSSETMAVSKNLPAGTTTRSSVSSDTKWNNQGKKNDEEAHDSKTDSTGNAVVGTSSIESHITNEKLLSMASKHLLTLTALDVSRKQRSASLHNAQNTESEDNAISFNPTNTSSIRDPSHSHFKMDPLLEFRPTIIKAKPGDLPEKKGSKHKNKNKRLSSWLWGSTASSTSHNSKPIIDAHQDGDSGSKLSSKPRNSRDLNLSSDQESDAPNLEMHLMDMSAISYKLASNKKTNDEDNTIIQSIRNASLDKSSEHAGPRSDRRSFHAKSVEEERSSETAKVVDRQNTDSEPSHFDDISLSSKPGQIDNEVTEFQALNVPSETQDSKNDLLGLSFQPLQPKKK